MSLNIVNIGIKTLELDEWISYAINQLKIKPADTETRFQLIELYILKADWERALQQLNTIYKISSESQKQVELLRNLILSENLRQQVLNGSREARSLEKCLPEWSIMLQQANASYGRGDYSKGEDLRAYAMELAPENPGSCDAFSSFNWLSDGDDRLGPICEFIYAGGYRWIPFMEINALVIEQPKTLMDIVWAKAIITLDKPIHGFIPARYLVNQEDEQYVKAGLSTNWQEQEKGRFICKGRKMWATSAGECSLFEAGKINFDVVEK